MNRSGLSVPAHVLEEDSDKIFLEYALHEKEKLLSSLWAEEAKGQAESVMDVSIGLSQKERADRALHSCRVLLAASVAKGDWAMIDALTFVASEIRDVLVALGERS